MKPDESTMDLEARCAQWTERFQALTREVGRVMVGQHALIEDTLVALLAGGHVLLEGVPGVGKTLLVKTLAQCLDLSYSRIQFTPDLMPADVLGTQMVHEDEKGRKRFEFQKGPIFACVLLADEINRATPKTQSALLEAMQEATVHSGNDRFTLPEPFFVLATQNPIEMEGTFPLPEAQLDRFFFKIDVGLPSEEELVEIFERTTGVSVAQASRVADGAAIRDMQALARQVPIAPHLADYVARLVTATHPRHPKASDVVRRVIQHGASPRAGQAIVLGAKVRALVRGGVNVSGDDIRRTAPPALRHRLILSFEAEADGMRADDVLGDLIAAVPELGPRFARR